MEALLVVPLIGLIWALSFVLAMVSAHLFLVILDSTAAGGEKIVWPREGIIEWFWKLFYLAWLGGAWIVPFVILSRLATSEPELRTAVVMGSSWLFFPIGVLSSQSANSPWSPYSPRLPGRLKQRPGAVLNFYVLSIPVFAIFAGAMYGVIIDPDSTVKQCLILAPLAAAAYFIYARALGWLALILSFTKGGENEPGARRRKRKKKKAKPQFEEQPAQPRFVQPSELPPIETPYEGPITGYDVKLEDLPPTAPQEAQPNRGKSLDDDEADLTPFAVEAMPAAETAVKPELLQAPAAELELWDTSKRVKEPKSYWKWALIAFLWEPGTVIALIILTAGLAILGLLINMLHELRPE